MKDNTKALLAYLAVCFFWGSTYIAMKIGVKDLPPLLFSSSRLLIAGSIMLIYAKIKGLPFPKGIGETAKISLVGFLMLTGGMGLFVTSAQWLDAGVASIMVASVPLMMASIEVFILKEKKISALGVIGLLIGFGGIVFLSMGVNGIGNANIKGVFFILSACLFWSIGSVYSKRVKTESALVTNIAIQMLAGGFVLLIIGLSLGEASRFVLTMNSALAIIYLVIFGSIIGYSAYIYVLKAWPIAKAGTYAYINPVIAVLLGALILGESITYKVVISLIIILTGVLLVQKSKIEKIHIENE
ncbi:MAG: EamA family transporter [Clostridiales bacterium]|nr:EamA family transporter [Clostridiales bacterium]